MFSLTLQQWVLIGFYLEGFFFGLYCAIFIKYIQYQALQNKSLLFYVFCGLYTLSVVVVVLDITTFVYVTALAESSLRLVHYIYMISGATSGYCDFICQSILIYRCWVAWNRNIRVVIVPSILAFAFLGRWLSTVGSSHASPNLIVTTKWGSTKVLTACLAISLTVNVMVTGLILFRIFKVSSASQNSGTRGFRSIIFIIIGSSMALFSIQLARIVVTSVSTAAALKVSQPIVGIHQMLNGIAPTIVQVWVARLSFHDEKSIENVTNTGDYPNPNLEMRIPERASTSIDRLETRSRVTSDIGMNILYSSRIQDCSIVHKQPDAVDTT